MSIVNNNILSYFWTKLKNYIDNQRSLPSATFYRGSGSTQTGFSANTEYIVRFNTEFNNTSNIATIATDNSGLITINESGLYLINAKINYTSTSSANNFFCSRIRTNVTSGTANSGYSKGYEARYTYGSRCSTAPYVLDMFEAGEKLHVTAATGSADSSATIQQGLFYSHIHIMKVGPYDENWILDYS